MRCSKGMVRRNEETNGHEKLKLSLHEEGTKGKSRVLRISKVDDGRREEVLSKKKVWA